MDATEQAEFDRISNELSVATGKVTTLEGNLTDVSGRFRDFRHQTDFARLAIAAGVRPKAVDTFYRESGYQAAAEDFDTDGAQSLIESCRDRLDYLFAPAETTTPAATTTPAPAATTTPAKVTTPSAPGASRGAATPPVQAKLRVTRAQQADVKWMMANDAKLKEAGKKGLVEFD